MKTNIVTYDISRKRDSDLKTIELTDVLRIVLFRHDILEIIMKPTESGVAHYPDVFYISLQNATNRAVFRTKKPWLFNPIKRLYNAFKVRAILRKCDYEALSSILCPKYE